MIDIKLDSIIKSTRKSKVDIYSKHTFLDTTKNIIKSLDTIDKIYINYPNNGANQFFLEEWKDKAKTNLLHRSALKYYYKDSNYSFIVNYNGIYFVVLTNSKSIQLQFNFSKVSIEFAKVLSKEMFPFQKGVISRLACSVDIPFKFPFVLKNTRASRLRSCSVFSDIPRGVKIDNDKCLFAYSSERYGKLRQFQIYNKSKQAKIDYRIHLTRVEVNYDGNFPIKNLDEIPLLKDKNVFDLLYFRLNEPIGKISSGERRSLEAFESLQSDLNLSMTAAIQIYKRDYSDKEYDLLRKALNKVGNSYYDFNESFNQNLNILLSEKMTANEQLFLNELKDNIKSRHRDTAATKDHIRHSEKSFRRPITLPTTSEGTYLH